MKITLELEVGIETGLVAGALKSLAELLESDERPTPQSLMCMKVAKRLYNTLSDKVDACGFPLPTDQTNNKKKEHDPAN